jgi:hypothetical protein
MPTKHIDEETWKKVEKKMVDVVIETKRSIKEGKLLKQLILIGLKHYDEEQFDGEKKRASDSKAQEMRH